MKLLEYTLPSGASLTGWLREPSEKMPGYEERPAVLILPGGGYHWCSPREGDPVAAPFFAAGYHAFTLLYTTEPRPLGWQPLLDVAGALLYLRRNAAALHILPSKIAVCGFSAGGHLAGSAAFLWQAEEVQAPLGRPGSALRPDAAILCYPVITAGEHRHEGSFSNLAGADVALRERFSLEKRVSPGAPPCFVWHTVTDEAVPVQNSLLLAEALQRAHVPYELHLFAQGSHGSSTCTDEVGRPNAHNARWMPLCIEWLNTTFDFHI